jgi:hypothetical protein
MLKERKPSKLLSKGHKLVVNSLIGLTLFGLGLFSFNTYQYYRYIKPELEIQRKLNQQKLLNESNLDQNN